ncbi:MAG TPA: 23S rRNA (adenine(2030)-N(6))-methyltransferase RlmJ [Gammaproteobacteria bacterium]|nr:23S rRNA (adenine(2030)-N(6))-methyltransferase RlmJ [Gammaproteobacteria bacterium]
MNYCHLYHAGNFADVIKHLVLVSLATSLLRKETAFCFLDTHAGRAYYDLLSESAQKTKEYESGISKVMARENPPPLVKHYLACIQKINKQLSASQARSLSYYPGSSFIVRQFLRPFDRIVATELHPHEHQELKKASRSDQRLAIHCMDAYQSLKAFLPPPEKRGFVLIDPPYENPDEFKKLGKAIISALQRWQTGSYTIWYPLKERLPVDHFHSLLKKNITGKILVLELSIYPEDVPNRLNGCGLVLINPPWKFDQEMQAVLPWLWQTLSINQQGGFRLYFLKNEEKV